MAVRALFLCSQAGAEAGKSGRIGISTGRAPAALTLSAHKGVAYPACRSPGADPPCTSALQGWFLGQGRQV